MNQKDPVGNTILAILLILLAVAGYISYKSIDWDVLKRLEEVPLVLPTPIPLDQTLNDATGSATFPATNSAVITN